MSGEIKSKKHVGVYYKILKDGDKSFYITYKDLKGKKIWLQIGTFSQGIRESYCSEKRNQIMVKIKTGEEQNIITNRRIKKTQITLDQAEISYHAFRATVTKEKGLKDSKSLYNKYLKKTFGSCSIVDISKLGVLTFLESLKEDTNLSLGRINVIRSKLSSIINFAIENLNYTGSNVVLSVQKYKVTQIRTRYLTLSEIDLLKNEIKENKFLYLFTLIALSTGARLNAILSLKKMDINLDSNTISFKDFKNDDTYDAFIKDSLKDELINFIDSKKINEYLFKKDGIKDITKYVQRKLRPILNMLFNEGLEKKDNHRVVIHTFRHTFASQLAKNGVPIYTIKKLLNHKDIEMTMRYAKLSPEEGSKDINNLDF